MSSSSKKHNVSGPKTRKTLNSVRRQSHEEEDIIATSADLAVVNNPDSTMERSVNDSTSPYADGEDLIDSDHSNSDACTEDDEPLVREGTPIALQTSPRSLDRSRNTPLPQVATPITPREHPNPVEYAENGNMYAVKGILVAVVMLVLAWLFRRGASGTSVISVAEVQACEKFHTLENTYTNVDDTLWDSLDVSLRRATDDTKRREPGTFLFLHNGDMEMMNGFIDKVSNMTANCFGGSEPIVLGSKYFKRPDVVQDFGVFLSQQTSALREQGIMVVRNLEDIPPQAAQAFHSICDPYEPLVDRAVIYFTMDTSKVNVNVAHVAQSAIANAEQLLRLIWKDVLKPEILEPLIIRLTENVYRII